MQRLKTLITTDIMAGIIILISGLIRLIQYGFNRSLWGDEASLAVNLVNRSYGELLRPLDYNQGAPIGFLWVEKLATQLFGNNEYSLRLFPLLGGLAMLLLMYVAVRRYTKGPAVLVALVLVGFLPSFIYFSTEVKQYSTDAALTLGCLLLAQQTETKCSSGRQSVVLALLGSVAVWFSHTAVFALAGAAVGSLLKTWWVQKGFRFSSALIKRLLVYLSWLVSFGLFYLISLQDLGANQLLKSSWQGRGAFPNPDDNWIETFVWLLDRLGRSFYSPLGFASPWDGVAIAFFLIGCFSLYRRRELWVVLSPILFALFAACIGKYPFSGRLIFFLMPLLIVGIALGVDQLIKTRNVYVRFISISLAALLIFQPLQKSLPQLYTPHLREEIRPVIEYIQTHWQENDKLYIYQRGNLQFLFYTDRYGYRPDDYILGIGHLDNYDGRGVSAQERERYLRDLDQLRGNPRVWVLFSHASIDEENDLVLGYLNCLGKLSDSYQDIGAFVNLYDLSEENRQCLI
ncbi:glycosyltransferase family 39 protein [Leptothoe spongobia]|uniref:Glycosyltransferase family 39 protein n=1 Tax=Leptothoe spongobia TAU-MAC 1115 TaxID=1967444 RepID=A0A947DGF5_9CYAN|nr:glycosyltransferase family 39 protein [Leptothoe spongobia]MBT9316598.1 glycosyltransferase family 39 protein [Leptothoe spongobia TAU-MAC 1115]